MIDMNKIKERFPVLDELNGIHSFLNTEVFPDDGNELSARLTVIGAYEARLVMIAADARLLRDEATRRAFDLHHEMITGFRPHVATRYLSSLTPEENYLITIAEELLDVCKRQGDYLRTQISLIKSSMSIVC
jgi:hypothetical protein